MSRPRVTVLLPVRNGLPYLDRAINSVLSQTYEDFELIVVNDRSSDGSDAVVRSYRDPRIRLLGADGQGLARALNIGLAEAVGEYIARQDADDYSDIRRLARQVVFLDTYRRVDVLATRAAFVDEAGAPVDTEWTRAVQQQWDMALAPDAIARLMPLTCCIVHGTVMARRATLESVGGYPEDLPVAQDYDLWLRLLPDHRIARLPETLYTLRLHPRQQSQVAADEQRRQTIAAKLRYLRRTVGLPDVTRAWIADDSPGAPLYREALPAEGFVEVRGHDGWDVAIFTDFGALDANMSRVDAREWPAHTARVGNFLIRRRMAA